MSILSIHFIGIDVTVFHNASTFPVIGSSIIFTITCDFNVMCPGCNETLIVTWSLNGNILSINSATHTQSSGPYTVLGDSSFTSTLTTKGNISLSHAGLYRCFPRVPSLGLGLSKTIDINVKCK